MKLWIDGHNLIAALPDISLADPDDEARVTLRLQRYAWRTGTPVLVFFDHGQGGPSPMPSSPDVIVRFAPKGRSADDLIRGAIAGASRGVLDEVVLVTGDHTLAEAARAAGVKVQSSTLFARALTDVIEEQAGGGEETPALSPDDEAELLRQFEARHQSRAAARRAEPVARRRGGSPGFRPGGNAASAPPGSGGKSQGARTSKGSSLAKPGRTPNSDDDALLQQFEDRYSERTSKDTTAEPLARRLKRREPRSETEEESLLQQFEARYRARKRNESKEP